MQGLTQEQLATLAREVQRAAAQQAVANLIRSGELQQPAYAPPAAGGLLMPCPKTEQAALSAAFMPPASQEAFFAPAPPVGIPPRHGRNRKFGLPCDSPARQAPVAWRRACAGRVHVRARLPPELLSKSSGLSVPCQGHSCLHLTGHLPRA